MKRGKTFYIYLFRHGQTFYNEKGIFTGWKDSKLTKNGFENARTVAKKLKNKKINVAFHTRLSRSKQTLREVIKFHPECLKIIEDNRMIERSYGDIEGLSHKIFIEKIGKQALDLRIHGDALENLDKKSKKEIERFLGEQEYETIHRGYKVRPLNGESFYDVEKRVKKFISYLKKYIQKNEVNVMISAHGNSIRLFRMIWEQASVKEMQSWFIPYDKVYVYKVKV